MRLIVSATGGNATPGLVILAVRNTFCYVQTCDDNVWFAFGGNRGLYMPPTKVHGIAAMEEYVQFAVWAPDASVTDLFYKFQR